MKKEITIKREWFERLEELINLVADENGNLQAEWFNHLKGYISSLDILFEDEDIDNPCKKI